MPLATTIDAVQDGTETDDGDDGQLYPGDTGLLPEMARRALVQLLSGPSLEQRRHSRLWPALLQYQAPIRSRLADLFLELILDAERGVAFTRQADTGELETPILLRRSPLTFLDSVLLLYLRQVLVEADCAPNRRWWTETSWPNSCACTRPPTTPTAPASRSASTTPSRRPRRTAC
jgi:hypothetical protein